MGLPGPDAEFRDALNDGRFTIQKCGDCGTHIYYPRVLCIECGSQELNRIEPSGKGVVYSVTTLRRKPERGGDYNVCLVDLEEGVRVMSRVEGLAPDAVKIGMNVQAFVGEVDGAPNVLFRAVDGDAS